MIWALLEKLSSSSFFFFPAVSALALSFVEAADDATSFLARVFANRMEFS